MCCSYIPIIRDKGVALDIVGSLSQGASWVLVPTGMARCHEDPYKTKIDAGEKIIGQGATPSTRCLCRLVLF